MLFKCTIGVRIGSDWRFELLTDQWRSVRFSYTAGPHEDGLHSGRALIYPDVFTDPRAQAGCQW
jgi:hypothetical protein